MNDALTLGPLVLPYGLLLLLVAAAAATFIAKRMGHKLGVDVEPALWNTLLAAVLMARLAFVWEFRSAYLAAPLDIIDIRDGGWNPLAGIVGGWLFVLWRGMSRPVLKRPLRRALLTGTGLWLAGSVALAMLPAAAMRLPDLELSTLDGSAVRLDSFTGQPTVVNLWATWCPPCAREMPLLARAQRDNPAVHFVFLNQGESAEQISAWLAQEALPLRNVVVDRQARAAGVLENKVYPTTLFFDAQGELVATRIGELSLATLSEKLQLLKE